VLGPYSLVTMIFVRSPSSVVPTGCTRTTPSTSFAAAATSRASAVSATTRIGCASPAGKCAENTSSPAADSDGTRNFSTWSSPTEVPNRPAAITASSAPPASSATTGRFTTRPAIPRQAPPWRCCSPGRGTNGQNTFGPQTASSGGSRNSTDPSAISSPIAEEIPSPCVPGITASTRVRSASTTVTFEATIAGAVLRQAVPSARR
jgi:hypothetical protein